MLKYNYFGPEQPPSVERPKIILFHAWFHHKIILSKLRPWAEFSCEGAYWRVEISDFCLPATACCCLAITVDECSDWLQHCLMNIHAKIILFHFRRGSMFK